MDRMARRCSSLGKKKKYGDYREYIKHIVLFCVVCLCFLGNVGCLFGKITTLRPTSYKYINDYARVVDQNSAAKIINLGRELEQKTGTQAVVVTINTLNGVPIEDYANQLFRNWGVGQQNKDNGLLVLLAVQDRQWRVEVGRGLEGAIPDALSNQIMQELGSFAFSKGYYGQGLAQVYSQFCDEIANEYNVTLSNSLQTSLPVNTGQTSSRAMSPALYFLVFGILIFDLFFNRGRLWRLLFWSSLFSGGRNNRGGGGYGGFGGGSSNGGGSSGSW